MTGTRAIAYTSYVLRSSNSFYKKISLKHTAIGRTNVNRCYCNECMGLSSEFLTDPFRSCVHYTVTLCQSVVKMESERANQTTNGSQRQQSHQTVTAKSEYNCNANRNRLFTKRQSRCFSFSLSSPMIFFAFCWAVYNLLENPRLKKSLHRCTPKILENYTEIVHLIRNWFRGFWYMFEFFLVWGGSGCVWGDNIAFTYPPKTDNIEKWLKLAAVLFFGVCGFSSPVFSIYRIQMNFLCILMKCSSEYAAADTFKRLSIFIGFGNGLKLLRFWQMFCLWKIKVSTPLTVSSMWKFRWHQNKRISKKTHYTIIP